MRPLVLLVIAEAVILLMLAVQWLGGASASAREQPGVALPAAPSAAAAPVLAASLSPPTAPAATATAANALPERVAAEGAPARAVADDPVGILLTGRVRSRDGTPVEGASVGLQRDQLFRYSADGAPGAYAVAGLQPGEWTLTCTADGFGPLSTPCVLDERAFQTFDLELAPTFVVRVKVVGADGKPTMDEVQKRSPFGEITVVATDTELAGDLPTTFYSRPSNVGHASWHGYDGRGGKAQPQLLAAGYFGELRLTKPPPAVASLLLRSTLLQSQPLAAGQQEVVFTLDANEVLARHGTVRLRAIDAVTGEPLVGVGCTVSTAGGGRYGPGGPKTGADGVIVLEHVLPGIGCLEATAAGRERATRFVRVPAGGTLDLGDFPLGAAETLRGVVLGADGKPANGVSVRWTELDARTFPQPPMDNRSTLADAEGRFEIAWTGRHRYVVSARGLDRERSELGFATVDCRNGAVPDLTLRLARTGSVLLRANVPASMAFLVTALAADRTPVAVVTITDTGRAVPLALPPGSYTLEIHDLGDDRLVRSVALQVGTEPLTLDVP